MRLVRTAAIYFSAVFALAFCLGVVRTLWVVPAIGVRYAELAEMPIVVLASYLIAREVLVRFGPLAGRQALGAGFLALFLLVSAEIGLTLLSGRTIADYFSNRDPVSGPAYALAVLLFALMPYLVARRQTLAHQS
ncbi:MAG: hypothetical protein IPK97_21180 [Ahniella sp.]|nr:hypothetical protein [Ahniella sp.]